MVPMVSRRTIHLSLERPSNHISEPLTFITLDENLWPSVVIPKTIFPSSDSNVSWSSDTTFLLDSLHIDMCYLTRSRAARKAGTRSGAIHSLSLSNCLYCSWFVPGDDSGLLCAIFVHRPIFCIYYGITSTKPIATIAACGVLLWLRPPGGCTPGI
jgi:hypothetical protein